jgi:hypothetical protein
MLVETKDKHLIDDNNNKHLIDDNNNKHLIDANKQGDRHKGIFD